VTKFLVLAGIMTVFVGACGPTMPPQMQAQRAENLARNEAIWNGRSGYSVNGLRYEIGVSADRRYALVAPVDQATFSLSEVEAAAHAATGCRGSGDSMLRMLGAQGGSRIPVSALVNLGGKTRVELSC